MIFRAQDSISGVQLHNNIFQLSQSKAGFLSAESKYQDFFLYLVYKCTHMKKYLYPATFVITFLLNAANSAAQWNPDKNINNPVVVAANRQEFHAMCTDNSGGVIMAWYDSRNNPALYDVYIQRLDADGIPLWTENGISMGIVTSTTDNISMAPVAGGGAIIAFMGGPSGNVIYAQRINGNGDKIWNNGTPLIVCFTTNNRSAPAIAYA